jgi:hypothetical protein
MIPRYDIRDGKIIRSWRGPWCRLEDVTAKLEQLKADKVFDEDTLALEEAIEDINELDGGAR